MKRDYNTGVADNAIFFFGKEVEHTPAHGMETLFVTGIQTIDDIEAALASATYETNHIFFGANHSFNPQDYKEHIQWEEMIMFFLQKEYLCSLDIPINQVEEFHESGYCEYNNFIPQIRIPIPYIKLWNYNTMLKLMTKILRQPIPVYGHTVYIH